MGAPVDGIAAAAAATEVVQNDSRRKTRGLAWLKHKTSFAQML